MEIEGSIFVETLNDTHMIQAGCNYTYENTIVYVVGVNIIEREATIQTLRGCNVVSFDKLDTIELTKDLLIQLGAEITPYTLTEFMLNGADMYFDGEHVMIRNGKESEHLPTLNKLQSFFQYAGLECPYIKCDAMTKYFDVSGMFKDAYSEAFNSDGTFLNSVAEAVKENYNKFKPESDIVAMFYAMASTESPSVPAQRFYAMLILNETIPF